MWRIESAVRYRVERVLDNHGVNHGPVTGVGRGQQLLEDIVQAVREEAVLDAVGEGLGEAITAASLFRPDTDAIKAQVEGHAKHGKPAFVKAFAAALKDVDWETAVDASPGWEKWRQGLVDRVTEAVAKKLGVS